MALFFTADTHFGHSNIIKHCGRPFEDAHSMNRAIMSRWNTKVAPNDTIYHLGDFAFSKDPESLLKRLNGRIHLVCGNHDKAKVRNSSLWKTVSELAEISYNGQRIVLCHYPLLTWNKKGYGSWMLHGHCHGRLSMNGDSGNEKRLDVGVDNHPNYEPFSYEEVVAIMEAKDGSTD